MEKSIKQKVKEMMIKFGENPKEAETMVNDINLVDLAKRRGAKTPRQYARDIKSFKVFGGNY